MKEEQPQTNTDTQQPQTENKEQELTQNKEQEITMTPVDSKPKPDFEFVESPHRIDYLEDGTQVTVVDVDPENPVTRIQSLCMECGEQGWTSFLLWDVAHFKKLVISSFMCPYCGEKNNSVQHGGSTEEKGVRYSLRVTKMEDFNRQIIKSDWSVIRIPDVDLEIPAETQKGSLSTIEGVLMQTYDSISHLQPLRRIEQPEAAEKLDEFLKKLKDLMELKTPFVFLLDDFSGNSFIENPFSPKEDPELIVEHYVRSQEQDWKLGIDTEAERQRKLREEKLLREMEQVHDKQEKERDDRAYDRQLDSELKGEFVRAPGSDSSSIQSSESLRVLSQTLSEVDIDERIISFVVPCSACPYEGEQRMVTINIPYFKDIVVMAFSCPNCGYKNSEIKTGGSISPKGKKLTLQVKNDVDLARDVLKSDTASLFIPEIELRVDYGSFGGRFTTVEGILNCIREDIAKNPFIVGDSSDQSAKERFKSFVNQIKRFQSGKEPFTLIIDDPVSNSYIQNIFWPEKDEQLVEEEYERSFQQNEDLGLNDIKTDNYIETNEPERVYGKPEEPVPEVELNPHHSKGKKD